MRIGVVTPWVGEPDDVVARCIASVAAQVREDFTELVFVLVSDGRPLPRLPVPTDLPVHGIALPTRTSDGGGTPRAVGSAFLLAHGVDALAYLDVDNTFLPDHLAHMVQSSRAADVVSAQRWLCHAETGEQMRVDTHDSDGRVFTDPSCVFLSGSACWIGRLWGSRDPEGRFVHNTMQDRHFWSLVQRHVPEARRTRAERATVAYRTPWLRHYPVGQRFQPPARVKLMAEHADGRRQAVWGRVTGRTTRGWNVAVDLPDRPT